MIEVCVLNKLINSKTFITVNLVQLTVAVIVSQFQSLKIKKNAKETKFIQLGFALLVFLISLGQTTFLVKVIKSASKSN
jgi:hypothetical protein